MWDTAAVGFSEPNALRGVIVEIDPCVSESAHNLSVHPSSLFVGEYTLTERLRGMAAIAVDVWTRLCSDPIKHHAPRSSY